MNGRSSFVGSQLPFRACEQPELTSSTFENDAASYVAMILICMESDINLPIKSKLETTLL